MRIDKTVKRELLYMLLWTFVLSVLMQAVFLVARSWDITVLFGNLLGYFAINLNFLLMGITVQNAVNKDEKDAKALMRASQGLRTLMIFVFAVIGVVLPFFNTVSFVITLLFHRLALGIRTLTDRSIQDNSSSEDTSGGKG